MARDHGISQGTEERYAKGNWRYEIKFVGWHMKNTYVVAAIGLEQLKKLDRLNEKRQKIIEHHNKNLNLDRKGNHLYWIIVQNRDEFVEKMKQEGISVSVHFLPLHQMPAFKDYPHEQLNNTEYFGQRLVSLPLYPQMTLKQIDFISKAVLKYAK